MRLWHEALLPYLPRPQLLGQHRECCALRGLGWGKPHATVNYVFEHYYGWLVAYHFKVIEEMNKRGYREGIEWDMIAYRGKKCDPLNDDELITNTYACEDAFLNRSPIYPEHNADYLRECLENLADKGIHIEMEHTYCKDYDKCTGDCGPWCAGWKDE